jgi:ergothioneine biosynthesis protein EgtB
MVVQSMDDVSPSKWHLAHTTWFFETFVLEPFYPGYRCFNPAYAVLFNSYYNSVGDIYPRPDRGLLSRPTVAEVYDYREHVDAAVTVLMSRADQRTCGAIADVMTLGCHHEQQHQELILTDIKHVLSCNPLQPAYRANSEQVADVTASMGWARYEAGLVRIGAGAEGFAFDNERPRHRTYVAPFELAGRPVTNGEYIDFMEDGGYRQPGLWLSDGWNMIHERRCTMPLYWQLRDGVYHAHTLSGTRPVVRAEPVCHVSYYEADAFARWAEARLPTEAEWEIASEGATIGADLLETGALHPRPTRGGDTEPVAMLGNVWEWTSSPYTAYPGYKTAAGALGEYNGKFMSGQMVLRGGSCLTAATHIRSTYRNFFPPDARWQMTGLRLARDAR